MVDDKLYVMIVTEIDVAFSSLDVLLTYPELAGSWIVAVELNKLKTLVGQLRYVRDSLLDEAIRDA